MNKERLLRVVDALEKASPESFNLGVWAETEGCLTVACAVGHYVLANPNCGLALGWFGDTATLFGHNDANFEAAAAEFEITKDECLRLFSGSEYPHGSFTRKCDIVARILEFVK